MFARIGFVAFALALVVTTSAAAETITGRVVRVDPAARIIEFDDGRSVKLGTDAVLYVENRPVVLETVRPGTSVVVVPSGARATTVVTPAPAATVVTPAPPAAVITAPPPVTVVTPPATVVTPPATTAQVIQGTVARVEPDGTIVLTDGRLVRMGPNAAVIFDGRAVPASTIRPGAVLMVEPTADYPSASVIETGRILIVYAPQAP